MIDPILDKAVVRKAGQNFIIFNDQELEFDDKKFKLFLTTKYANPEYTPEIMSRTMVINYTVTKEGLRDQLLNVVVNHEKEEIE